MQEVSADPPSDESPTPGDLVRAGVIQLMRWTARGQGRKELFGPAAEDMSANDVVLLDFIHNFGPVRLSELASQHGVDKSTMTPQVNRLDSKDLIERHNDPDDARATLVSTSPEGRELQRRIGAAGAELFDELLAGWSKKDRQALATLLDRFVRELVASHPGDSTT